MATNSAKVPNSFGILVFPGFEALDAFGTLQVFNDLSRDHEMTLAVIAEEKKPVSTRTEAEPAQAKMVSESIMPTHTLAESPPLDVLLVPGGHGGFHASPALVAWLAATAPRVPHVLCVCNGSALMAHSGALDGRRATTNKAYWKECTAQGPRTNWVARARWVHDGNFWTSSGVSAGIDSALAWVEHVFGAERATRTANGMEFIRAKNSEDDPFTEMYNCKDVPAQA